MQEWMIAMLVISIMLIIRDMAKTILAENLPDTEELPSLHAVTGAATVILAMGAGKAAAKGIDEFIKNKTK